MTNRNRGYTSLELATVMAVAISAAGFFAYGVMSRIRIGNVQRSVDTALEIAQLAEQVRHQTSSTTTNPDGSVNYTYKSTAGYVSASTFNTTYGVTVPTRSPWGSDYEVNMPPTALASVRYTIPFTLPYTPSKTTISVLAGTTTVVATAATRGVPSRLRRGGWVKRNLYGETQR